MACCQIKYTHSKVFWSDFNEMDTLYDVQKHGLLQMHDKISIKIYNNVALVFQIVLPYNS